MQSVTVLPSKDFVLSGRILYLVSEPHTMRAQLQGASALTLEMHMLRHEVSTDEIIPARHCLHVDSTLGRYLLTGLSCNDVRPVLPDAVKSGGFEVLVAGRRYGKGSSREAAPLAEWHAGIRLVIAESFERIYRENAHNIGLYTSTDFGLIERLQRGETILLKELTQGLDSLSRTIVNSGGLLASGDQLAAALEIPRTQPPVAQPYGYKVIARACGLAHVQTGQAVIARPHWRFAYDLSTAMAANLLAQKFGTDISLHDPVSILLFQDHLALAAQAPARDGISHVAAARLLMLTQRQFAAKHHLALHDADQVEGSEGICHAIMAERYVLPGQLVCGTDSHTSHAGSLGVLAFGIGATAMAHAFVSGDVCIRIPPASRIRVTGNLPSGVQAKDLLLHLLRLPLLRQGGLVGHLVHWEGEGLQTMSTDERTTLTNMGAEMGAFSAIMPPDNETQVFLGERRGVFPEIKKWMNSDADCEWVHDVEVLADSIVPMVAAPGDPGLGLSIDDVGIVPVNIAYGGSCTGGKWEDWVRYHEVLSWGLARGLRVPTQVKLYLQYGSADVRLRVQQANWEADFLAVGAHLVEPGCGACIDMGPGASIRADDVTISAQNRNFPGRSGPGNMWLASPATVAASALMGRLVSFEQLQKIQQHDNTY